MVYTIVGLYRRGKQRETPYNLGGYRFPKSGLFVTDKEYTDQTSHMIWDLAQKKSESLFGYLVYKCGNTLRLLWELSNE